MPDEKTPKYRVLWTWDHSVRWDHQFYWKGFGASGANDRRGYFLDDYRRMVDFSAAHGVNGIVVWGALRAACCGEDQLRELVAYGKQKGVRILPGVGTHAYGGVYFDPRRFGRWSPMGRHKYCMHTWLSDHPELALVGADGKPCQTHDLSVPACPSRPETLEWFIEGLQWLLTEFGVEGVQIEIGDYAVCHCDLCKERRGTGENGQFDVNDMIEVYARSVEAARAVSPDAWVICESYSSFARPTGDDQAGFGQALDRTQKDALASLPGGAIVQWVLDRAVGLAPTQEWGADCHPPTRDNIARIHPGSQWDVDGIEGWHVHAIGDLVAKARMYGLNGVSIFGEEAPTSPPNEANYLVFAELNGFGNPNPDCDMDLFFTRTLDPLYGGAGMARQWERIYVTGHVLRWVRKPPRGAASKRREDLHLAIGQPELLDRAVRMDPAERRKATARLAEEAHSISSKLSGEPCRRWSWLENWLWRAEYLHRTEPAL